jgi:hypothetical protein
MEFNFVHFTHYGYLQNTFPKEQIEKILDVFLQNNKIDCEVCWDIDEKFFDEMHNLLKECLLRNNKDEKFNSYDEENFKW